MRTNECRKFDYGSYIDFIPLTADDLIPDVNCNCDFEYVAVVNTGAPSNKNETADGDTAKDETADGDTAKDETADGEAPVTSGSEHFIEQTAKMMAMLTVSLSAAMI